MAKVKMIVYPNTDEKESIDSMLRRFKRQVKKEVTYEEWQKNPTPRMMWVWDNDKYEKKKRKVVYVLSGASGKKYNVMALNLEETCTTDYAHCAEIEEPETRRMTNKELARWYQAR